LTSTVAVPLRSRTEGRLPPPGPSTDPGAQFVVEWQVAENLAWEPGTQRVNAPDLS